MALQSYLPQAYMFTGCSFIQALWHMMLSSRPPPLPLPCKALLEQWQSSALSIPGAYRKSWSSLVQLVWWHTWKKHNERVFGNQASLVHEVFGKIVADLSLWH
jgi:hypothetical protein